MPSFWQWAVIGVSLRLSLIVYSVYHDAHSTLKYTDVDYYVFTDAARYIVEPEADDRLGIGSPYRRSTYRYTPLLALLLTPNVWLHEAWGKSLFALADLGVACILERLLKKKALLSQHKRRWLLNAVWWLNPIAMNISTRGSSESLLGLLVVGSLYAFETGALAASACLLGVAIHLKLYPVIYGLACWSALHRRDALLNSTQIRYALISASTLAALNAACYLIWSWDFIEHTYLYHLHRLDHRHNFSVYHYSIYLSYGLDSASWLDLPWVSFVPQLGACTALGLLLGSRSLGLAWFAQTVAFVALNKVCTSQYFMWYLWLLPLILASVRVSRVEGSLWLLGWIAGQALWLSAAFRLEMLGHTTYYQLWQASVLFLLTNIAILCRILSTAADALRCKSGSTRCKR
ncbi:glycosyltransferase family 50 protein [Mixia osmundae IAM 14324]|uniref:GPI mannosyltransferase 1 n=1 Tax=Mixia osmundae (strain CBS 9802 / IAM 14324 / JCM 22182 / KY 12970) TaxID=764103 RepID=G7E8M1_MIXOS|nr:glycosyltransferase family 50 protein [Mixia osmundae IAM 14324]KEI40123.1 glycosyltransferase family 50 protein [Mixia osmundae IAM 14324]GAA99489.1 hypothetical protein E5Q_06189 [Mixia osmundae IAM 14324]